MPLGSAEALALTGMMGAGKSTVARELGRLLGRRVVSTDAEVVRRAGKPIAAVFAEDGEPAFRALERSVVATLTGPLVLDLGGGAFCDPAGAARLLATARVVFLDVSPEEAARRLGPGAAGAGDPEAAAEPVRGDAASPPPAVRPLLGQWAALRARRLPLYRRAHLTVEVDGLCAEAVARRIAALVTVPAPEPLLEGP
jgi:shikimate kinase